MVALNTIDNFSPMKQILFLYAIAYHAVMKTVGQSVTQSVRYQT